MKKICYILFTLLCFSFFASASDGCLTGDARMLALERLDAFNAGIRSLECDFVQTVHSQMMDSDMQSSGKVRIGFPARLEVEMLSPYNNIIVLDLSKPGRPADRAMSAIMPLISGGLASNRSFTIEIYEEDGQWRICLDPMDRNIKEYVNGIELLVGIDDGVARSIEMRYTADDYVRMVFTKVKIVR